MHFPCASAASALLFWAASAYQMNYGVLITRRSSLRAGSRSPRHPLKWCGYGVHGMKALHEPPHAVAALMLATLHPHRQTAKKCVFLIVHLFRPAPVKCRELQSSTLSLKLSPLQLRACPVAAVFKLPAALQSRAEECAQMGLARRLFEAAGADAATPSIAWVP